DAEQTEYHRVMKHGLFGVSDEAHARMRRLAAPSFGARSAERLRPAIVRIVDEAIDQTTHNGVLDGCALAAAVPLQVMRLLLGVPYELEAVFRRFSAAVITALNPSAAGDKYAGAIATFPEGAGVLRALLAEREKHPIEGDLLSELIHASDHGE